MEEADIRLVELKKASYEFDRDVAKVLKEKRGVIVAAEKIVRYMEDRMRAKVSGTAPTVSTKGAVVPYARRNLCPFQPFIILFTL